jgi:hypothetical protein
MFLKKVYKKNRLLFWGMAAFATCQLFINYKVGLTATPFLHYGMYSSPFLPYKSINVWELEINGKKQTLSGYHPRIVEQILEPVKVYLEQAYSNSLYDSHIKHFLKLLPLDSNSFTSHVTKKEFSDWYKQHLTRITNKEVTTVKVFESQYLVKKSSLTYNHKSLLLYDSN